MSDIELIKLPEVMRITGMSQSFIYGKAAAGQFPRQVKLGERSVAWIKSEVLSWLEKRIALSRSIQ